MTSAREAVLAYYPHWLHLKYLVFQVQISTKKISIELTGPKLDLSMLNQKMILWNTWVKQAYFVFF